MAISKFYRGSATFTCDVCGRLTRHTGVQSAGNKLCPQCFDLAGLENGISDGHHTQADVLETITQLVADIAKHGGNTSDWIETFNLVKEGK